MSEKCGAEIDMDGDPPWRCVKDAGHRDAHYAEAPDGASGMAVTLSAEEQAYWRGFDAATAEAAERRGFRPGIYQHYKGDRYRALFLAAHHETREPWVVYLSLTSGSVNVRRDNRRRPHSGSASVRRS